MKYNKLIIGCLLFIFTSCSKTNTVLNNDDAAFKNISQKNSIKKTNPQSYDVITNVLGVVQDQNGSGISGASVQRKSNLSGVYTASTGGYALLISGPTTDTLVVSALRYQTVEQPISVPAGGLYIVPTIYLPSAP